MATVRITAKWDGGCGCKQFWQGGARHVMPRLAEVRRGKVSYGRVGKRPGWAGSGPSGCGEQWSAGLSCGMSWRGKSG